MKFKSSRRGARYTSASKSLQRTVNHKVLGHGEWWRRSGERQRARVLTTQPAAAELSR
jgi:hypothetical protein